MEKINFIIWIIVALALIGVIIYLSQNIKGQYFLSEEDKRFLSLCAQWKGQNCTGDAIPLIDKSQQAWGDPTLTEVCVSKFPLESIEKSLVACQDVCKADCISKLYYDLAVFDHDITKDDNNIYIIVENIGTATAYDVKVRIIGIGKGYQTDQNITVMSQSSNKIQCSINLCGTDIRIEIDPDMKIKESNEENNIAKQEWNY